jgi:hypothetical protein
MSDDDVIRKLDRLQAVVPALLGKKGRATPRKKNTQGAGKRAADFQDLPDNVRSAHPMQPQL